MATSNDIPRNTYKCTKPILFTYHTDQAIGKWQIKGSCFCLAYPGRIVLGDLQYEKGQYTIQGNSINIGLQNIGNVTNAICEIKSKKTGPQISHTLQQDGNQVQTIHCCKEGSNTSIYFQVCEGDLRYGICSFDQMFIM